MKFFHYSRHNKIYDILCHLIKIKTFNFLGELVARSFSPLEREKETGKPKILFQFVDIKSVARKHVHKISFIDCKKQQQQHKVKDNTVYNPQEMLNRHCKSLWAMETRNFSVKYNTNLNNYLLVCSPNLGLNRTKFRTHTCITQNFNTNYVLSTSDWLMMAEYYGSFVFLNFLF